MRTKTAWTSLGRNTQNSRFTTGSGKFAGTLGSWAKGADQRLIEAIYAEFRGQVPDELLRKAVGEAEALAWTTSHPLLFLPGLAEEKISKARQWVSHQQVIRAQQATFATAE